MTEEKNGKPDAENPANSLKNAPSQKQVNFTADAIDCFWNAAIGAAHHKDDYKVTAVVSCIAEGIHAIAQHLRESEAPAPKAIDAECAWEAAMMAAIGADDIVPSLESSSYGQYSVLTMHSIC